MSVPVSSIRLADGPRSVLLFSLIFRYLLFVTLPISRFVFVCLDAVVSGCHCTLCAEMNLHQFSSLDAVRRLECSGNTTTMTNGVSGNSTRLFS